MTINSQNGYAEPYQLYSESLTVNHKIFPKGNVVCAQFTRVNHSEIKGNLQSDLSVKLNSTHVLGSVCTRSFLEATQGQVTGEIQAQGWVSLSQTKVGGDICSERSYVRLENSESSNITAYSRIEANQAKIGACVSLNDSVLLNKNSRVDCVRAKWRVRVCDSQVQNYIWSERVELVGAKVGQVAARNGNLSMSRSSLDEAEASKVLSCQNTVITDELKCRNHHLVINDSEINELVLDHPDDSSLTGWALELKKLYDAGQVGLQPHRLILGKPSTGEGRISAGALLSIESYNGLPVSMSVRENSVTLCLSHMRIRAYNEQHIATAIQKILGFQVVVLNNSRVGRIVFKNGRGQVKLTGTSTVKFITGGSIIAA